MRSALNTCSAWIIDFFMRPVVPSGDTAPTNCGVKRHGSNSGTGKSRVLAPKDIPKSTPENIRTYYSCRLIVFSKIPHSTRYSYIPINLPLFTSMRILFKCRSPMPSIQFATFIVAKLMAKLLRSTKKLSGELLRSINAVLNRFGGN